MCDDEIHQGTPLDPALSRRAFGATAFAVTAFSAAELQAQAAGKTWTRVKVVSTLKKSRRLEWRLTEGDAATAA